MNDSTWNRRATVAGGTVLHIIGGSLIGIAVSSIVLAVTGLGPPLV